MNDIFLSLGDYILITSLLAAFLLLLFSLFRNAFGAKLRYGVWILFLVAALVPVRSILGQGLVPRPPVFSSRDTESTPMEETFALPGRRNCRREQPPGSPCHRDSLRPIPWIFFTALSHWPDLGSRISLFPAV